MTQKFNSISNQYEYFDSSGNLVGYKKYNSISKQWEYYDLKSSYSNSQSLQRKPYQYRDPEQIDMSATYNALSKLQGNRNDVQKAINDIVNQVQNMNISESRKASILDNFSKTVDANRRRVYNGDIDLLYTAINVIIENQN